MKLYTFELRIVGTDVSPSTVRASDLGNLLCDFAAAVSAEAGVKGTVRLSLSEIKDGSERLLFKYPRRLQSSLRRINRSIASGDFSQLNPRTHKFLHDISQRISRRDWTLRWEAAKEQDFEVAVVSCDAPIPERKVVRYRGRSTVFGKLISIGGKSSPRGKLELASGGIVRLGFSSEALARALGARLYQVVGVRGEGVWEDAPGSPFVEFTVEEVLPYEGGSILEAFQELATLSDGCWDDVDPAEYVREQRGDEDE